MYFVENIFLSANTIPDLHFFAKMESNPDLHIFAKMEFNDSKGYSV